MPSLKEVTQKIQAKTASYISTNEFLFLAIIIIFVGALWRIWGLGSFKGFSKEELVLLGNADRFMKHPEFTGDISNIIYSAKLGLLAQLTHFSPLILRLFSAITGILASLFFFLFVKSWFNKQVALIATLLMATNTTMLIFSSVVSPVMLVIALQMAILYFITIAFRDKNWLMFILSAILSAAGIFLSPFFTIMGVLIFVAGIVIALKNPKVFQVYRWQLIVTVLIIAVASGTYIYLMRSQFGVLASYLSPGSFATFYINIGTNILSLFSGSAYLNNVTVSVEPLLDPFVSISTVCGVVYAFFHGGKRKHQFILLWLLIGLVLVSLAATQTIQGLSLILPVVFIISAMMLDYLLTSWVRTFPYNKSARLAMTLIFSLFLFLSVYYNFQKYFYGWQGNPKISNQYTNQYSAKK